MSKRISVKWKIFLYMLGFTGILLALLWLFQTVHLDEFYKTIKTKELKEAFGNTEQVIEDTNILTEDITDKIDLIGSRYDMCILITDIYGNKLYASEQNMQCDIHKMRRDELVRLIISARNNTDTYAENLKNEPHEMPWLGMWAPRESESVVKVDIVRTNDDKEVVIMINTVLTPVDATVHTLRIQLIYISVIMVVLSLAIAMLISYRISKPIIKVNESAKLLGKGDYHVQFEGDNYKEIAQLSETLNKAAVELAKAESLQRELIANVSHDLRTPLTMITAYAEVMRDLPGENTPENVQVVIDEARRLTSLVNDLLDVSKLQAGVTELNLKEYDLTTSIESVLNRYSKFLEQNGYTIEFKYDKHVEVCADEEKIYQVIYNLVNNAINYTGEDKKVIVNQRVVGSIARIEVVDFGEGIAEEELVNVWERYYKVDKNHKRAVMGTGLGLSIVKNILKLHKVQFGVESKIGIGTCFWFELKIK